MREILEVMRRHITSFLLVGVVLVAVALALLLWLRRDWPHAGQPTPTVTATPSATPQANITVTSPTAGATVENPITITGTARVFENTFNWRLLDAGGATVAEDYAMTDAPDAGLFGSYTIKIPVPVGQGPDFTVEVFDYSAKDGSVQDLVRIPVTLASTATMTVEAYFSNDRLDPAITCEQVFPVERPVVQTKEVAYLALTQLLSGPTAAEQTAGYRTSIPDGVRINSLVIRGTTAYVDFDGALDYQVGGSCRVSAIRHQIAETLEQFSSVDDVVISINGRTDDILQP